MNDQSNFSAGSSVRLIGDPGRTGTLTGVKRERAGRVRWQVKFSDGTSFQLAEALELVGSEDSDPVELFSKGKFGRAKELRGNLTYIRLNGRLANLIYSMETTNTDFYPYQFKPVLDFLDSPSNGLLIADEVGLGKTIEAGLIWTELRSRYNTRRLLILCPAMLREKWQNELQLRFGINADILDSGDVLKKLKSYRSGTINEFAIIASMQGMRPRRGWDDDDEPAGGSASELSRYLKESALDDPFFDLLIIDEAHYMRNPESMTSKLGRILRDVSDHAILLSATPVNLKSMDLYHLLNLVDQDSFNQPNIFDEVMMANAPLISARECVLRGNINRNELIELLIEATNHPLLHKNRQLKELIEELPDTGQLQDYEYRTNLSGRLEKMNLLGHAVTRTRKREVTEWRVVREPIAEYVPLSEVEREFYNNITELVLKYCASNDVKEGFLLVTPQRQLASSMPAALRNWQKKKFDMDMLYEDVGEDEIEEPGPLIGTLMDEAHKLGDLQLLWDNDSKYVRLKQMLKSYLREHPNEKIILFSYFKPTLWYLQERLREDGIEGAVLVGGMGIDKQQYIEDFKSSPNQSVLLSSEVASEGVDLQFSRVLINYDLPWNPMRVEQRIGRIDRLGQNSPKITIWNLFYENTIDARIYDRLFDRLGIFENTLGGLEAVLGEKIRQLTNKLLSEHLTEEQEIERIEQTAQALANLKSKEEELEEQAGNLIAHGGYILNQVKAAKELNRCISNHDLWVYIRDFMANNYPGCHFQQVDAENLLFDVRLSPEARSDLDEFLRIEKLHGKTRLAITESRPVRCEFKNKVSATFGTKPEYISQFHPLVRFASHQIRETGTKYYPVISVKLDAGKINEIEKGDYVFHIERWSVQGVRDIEQLCFLAKQVGPDGSYLSRDESEKLVTTAAMYGEDWLSSSNELDTKSTSEELEECIDEAAQLYKEYIKQISTENEDRASFQHEALIRHRDRQIRTQEEVRQKHLDHGRPGLVKMTDGKIRSIQENVQKKLVDIEKRRVIRHNQMEVCMGLIRVA